MHIYICVDSAYVCVSITRKEILSEQTQGSLTTGKTAPSSSDFGSHFSGHYSCPLSCSLLGCFFISHFNLKLGSEVSSMLKSNLKNLPTRFPLCGQFKNEMEIWVTKACVCVFWWGGNGSEELSALLLDFF